MSATSDGMFRWLFSSRSMSGHAGPSTARILVVGLVAGLWAVSMMPLPWYQHRPPLGEEHTSRSTSSVDTMPGHTAVYIHPEEHNIAVHLVRGHGYLSPMDPSATAPPSAWSAPIYPLILAAAYGIFGIMTPEAVTLLMFVNALCFGAAVAGMYELGRLLFHSHGLGILVAVLFAVHPLFLFFAGGFWDGMLSLSMFVWLTVTALWIGAAADRDAMTTRMRAVALGAAMGILMLTNSSYALTYPLLLVLAFPRGLRSKRWEMAGIALGMCLLVLAPWMIRNAFVFGRAPFVRSGVGIQFWLGNAPGERGWLDRGTYRLHPYFNPTERSFLLALGEPAYNDLCFDRFLQRVAEDVQGFWIRCFLRTGYLFLGEPTKPTASPFLLNATISVLGLAGMVAAWRLRYRWGGLAGLIVCTALPFIPTAVIDRYALPVRALLLLSAGSLLWMISVRAWTGQWPIAPGAMKEPVAGSQ